MPEEIERIEGKKKEKRNNQVISAHLNQTSLNVPGTGLLPLCNKLGGL
jgi:hypothetical protein